MTDNKPQQSPDERPPQTQPTGQRNPIGPSDFQIQRHLVLACTIVLLTVSGLVSWRFGSDGTARFVASATGRVGLVMGALWLAWPSLRKPASWLPPGLAVGGVIALAVIAAQPRLALVAIPALGVLFTVASIVRAFR